MKIEDLLSLYSTDSYILTIAHRIASSEKDDQHIQLKGLVGSLDAVLAATLQQLKSCTALYILNDREEAAYFVNDLQSLLPETDVLFYPPSYKRPYEFSEVDNASVLARAEILNKLNTSQHTPLQIVTYPEALTEKVINKRSLLANTFTIKTGEKLDQAFLSEFLNEYGFEVTDFVYEPGQFSIRGGIIDVFSYASEHPFRIELFGDEVDSIRFFSPESQLSVGEVQHVNVVPDIQQKLTHESRESFLEFLPKNALLWFKDVEASLEITEKAMEKAQKALLETTGGGVQVVMDPEALFETRRGFLNRIKGFKTIEFGKRFYFKPAGSSESATPRYPSKPQPSFNKDFQRLIDDFEDHQSKGYVNIIAAEQRRQLDRITRIFEDVNPFVTFRGLQTSFREGFIDEQLKIVCYTDHQIFSRFHRYRLKDRFSKTKAITLKELRTLQPGDYVTHVDYGIGRFAGMDKVDVNGKIQESVRLVYRDNDLLYVNVHNLHKIAKYTGKEGTPPAMSKLGSPEWENKKTKVKKQLKDIAHELIALYSKRRKAQGFAFSPENYLQVELETSFIYEDTPDQAKATTDVKADMEKPYPMDRLVCGDVGFGKTEIAIRAAFKAVNDSKQVAVLVPTTILAMQHFKTFSERLADFPANVEYINRFKSPKEIKATLKRVESGEVDILIGTHRILNKDVVFKDLGLLIVDEEQKFGVKAKDRLKELRVNVDVLTLTATPIPRTLHFSLMGARDLSVITTPPPNRQPVTTEVRVFDEEFIRDAISFELNRGGQVFFVHNRVNDIESIGNTILRLIPEARIGIAHGQMEGERLEKVMVRFMEGEYDVLLSTNIVESGIDIPNANTIIINSAHHFGLSDLHQLRGRVGRSNRKAFCYLVTPAISTLTSESRKRLQVLEEFSDLGDGFKVAMRDLDIRGAGNLLGAEQSGFVNDLGYEMYHKILDEAVKELKESEFKDLFAGTTSPLENLLPETQIDTDMSVLIPENYVKNISERLSLYTRLDNIKTEDELRLLQEEIIDRFGPLPVEVADLLKTVRVRWLAEELHLEKLVLKNNTLKGYFVSSPDDAFYQSETFGNLLNFIQQNPEKSSLKDIKGKLVLTYREVPSLQIAHNILLEMKGEEVFERNIK